MINDSRLFNLREKIISSMKSDNEWRKIACRIDVPNEKNVDFSTNISSFPLHSEQVFFAFSEGRKGKISTAGRRLNPDTGASERKRNEGCRLLDVRYKKRKSFPLLFNCRRLSLNSRKNLQCRTAVLRISVFLPSNFSTAKTPEKFI